MKHIRSSHVVTILATCITLAACSNAQRGAEEVARRSLKDPESAKFGGFYFNSKTQKACLTTNAKNAMGGYTGDQQVHMEKTKNGWSYVDASEESAEYCREYYADKSAETGDLSAEALEKQADKLQSDADNVSDQ